MNVIQISQVLITLKDGLIKLSQQFNERKELKNSANEMKIILKSKFAAQQNKINGAEIIQTLFASKKKDENDGFVAINTNWKLNPDKLTEHQKEKMKERRSDIPALYSNLSCSTESSSIKPWQPALENVVGVVEKTPPIKIIAEVIPGKHKRKYSISAREEPPPPITPIPTTPAPPPPPPSSSKETENDEETSSIENEISDKNGENILANNNRDSSNKNIIKNKIAFETAMKLNLENRIKELNIVDERKKLQVERELRKMRIDTIAGVEVIDSVRPRRSTRPPTTDSPKKKQRRSRLSNDSDRSVDSEISSKNQSLESVVNDSNEEIACSQDISQSVFTKPNRINRRYSMFAATKPTENDQKIIFVQKSVSPVKLVKSPIKLEKPAVVPTFHMSQMVQITNPEIIENLKQFSPPGNNTQSVKIKLQAVIEPVIKISEMETEPNTVEPIQKISEIETEPNTCNLSTTAISSSDVLNTDEKTAEFLNNTLNISPIKLTEPPPAATLPIQIPTKERITMKPVLSSPVNRKKINFPTESPSRKPLTPAALTPIAASSPSQSRGQKMMEMMKINHKTSTPIEPPKKIINENHNNLLTFNKILPSPMASPSTSILKANKRKLIDVEQHPSPLNLQPDCKRSKRVSFNHPESVTREYIVVPEEKRDFQPLNRCLNLEEELDDDDDFQPKISIKELLKKHKSNGQLTTSIDDDDDDEIRKALGVDDEPSDIMPIDQLNEIITPPLVRLSSSSSDSKTLDMEVSEIIKGLTETLNRNNVKLNKDEALALITAMFPRF